MSNLRTFTFQITVDVAPGDPGNDDPEWLADAAWGALTNDYGLRCTYGEVQQLDTTDDTRR